MKPGANVNMIPFIRACRMVWAPIGAALLVVELDGVWDVANHTGGLTVAFFVAVVGALIPTLSRRKPHGDGAGHDAQLR
jgi:hypothetical protein